tara:strand:- start:81712 stop:82341 length:630 start_codon:yes stop_codon:yes gene_type:complete
MSDTYFYQPKSGHGLPHDPFKSIIGPRPIGWISSQDKNGVLNLAPYSFFNAFADNPPIIAFGSVGWKDSVQNIKDTGEFCWNLATRPLAEQMNQSCAGVPPEVDEFELAGLTPQSSEVISVPYVAETPVAFECRLTQLIQLQTAQGEEMPNWVIFGEVVGVHIQQAYLKDGIYQTAAAQPIMRAGGPASYYGITGDDEFLMYRPGMAPE